jgi:hypothetical protein
MEVKKKCTFLQKKTNETDKGVQTTSHAIATRTLALDNIEQF